MPQPASPKPVLPKPEASETAAISLEVKLRPSQARGQDTYEIILNTAGEMLRDIGFEQLSTNKVCEKAGLTPPALYRYFPNKYAILKALADRIMQEQDEAVFGWIADGSLVGATLEETQAKAVAIQTEIIEIVRRAPGGLAVLRAIRAVPLLQKLRFASRDNVAAHLADALRQNYAPADWPRLELGARMMVELLYAASEMVLEEPDRDAEAITREACLAFTLYFASFQMDSRRLR
jgi:AcrR family transcriptional regulator